MNIQYTSSGVLSIKFISSVYIIDDYITILNYNIVLNYTVKQVGKFTTLGPLTDSMEQSLN